MPDAAALSAANREWIADRYTRAHTSEKLLAAVEAGLIPLGPA